MNLYFVDSINVDIFCLLRFIFLFLHIRSHPVLSCCSQQVVVLSILIQSIVIISQMNKYPMNRQHFGILLYPKYRHSHCVPHQNHQPFLNAQNQWKNHQKNIQTFQCTCTCFAWIKNHFYIWHSFCMFYQLIFISKQSWYGKRW